MYFYKIIIFSHASTGSASCSFLKILQVKNGSNEFLNNCILSEDDQTEFTREKKNIKNTTKKSNSKSIKQTNLNGASKPSFLKSKIDQWTEFMI